MYLLTVPHHRSRVYSAAVIADQRHRETIPYLLSVNGADEQVSHERARSPETISRAGLAQHLVLDFNYDQMGVIIQIAMHENECA